MHDLQIMTIGGYGFTEDRFFRCLKESDVDAFVDVRRRRGMRGSKYSFLNSLRLQERLKKEDIDYIHCLDLAPTSSVREAQKVSDQRLGVQKSARSKLSTAFIASYQSEVLANFEPKLLIERIEHARVIALFCVEGPPAACHRSLAAERLLQISGTKRPVRHLRP